MGCDKFGNRYYENRIDYPWGQHRWVEPRDINNYDPTQIPPEWHGWMCHINDVTPTTQEEFIQSRLASQIKGEISHAPYNTNVGYQNEIFNFHGMHNQSQVRSRGYRIGNPITGLPPGAPDAFYTQPGSPYNPASRRKFEIEGSLDKDGGRAYKSEMWRKRLMTAAEREVEDKADQRMIDSAFAAESDKLTPRERAILARGGTISK